MEIYNMLLLLVAMFGLLGQSVAFGHGHLDGLINETAATGGLSDSCAGPSSGLSGVGINNTELVTLAPGFDKSTKTKHTSTRKSHNRTISTSWTPVTILDTSTAVLVIKPTNTTETITKLSTIESTTTSIAKFASTTETITLAVIVGYSTETIYTSKWLAPPQETNYTLTMISTSVSEVLVVPNHATYTFTSVPPSPTLLVKRNSAGDGMSGNTTTGTAPQGSITLLALTIAEVLTLPALAPGRNTGTQSSPGDTAAAHASFSTETSLTESLKTYWITRSDSPLGGASATASVSPSPIEENTTATRHHGFSVADITTSPRACPTMINVTHTVLTRPHTNSSSPGRQNSSVIIVANTTGVLVSRTTTVVHTVTKTAGASSSSPPSGEPGAWGSAPGGGGGGDRGGAERVLLLVVLGALLVNA